MNFFFRKANLHIALNKKVISDERQYAQLFAGVTAEKAIGESSVFYLCFPGSASRISAAIPDAKILILLREPVERAYSAYMHLVRDGRETLSFAEGLSREEERRQQGFEPMWWYKELGLYYSQVKRYLDVFGRERVKVLFYEELYSRPEQALRGVFDFLDVRNDVTIDTSVRYNRAGVPKSRKLYTLLDNFIHEPGMLEKRIKSLIPSHLRAAWASRAKAMLLQHVPLDAQLHAQLQKFFEEDVRKLEDLLQQDLHCWHYQKVTSAFSE